MSNTSQPVSVIGRVFQITAIAEAFTWTGLLAGMFLKYMTETTELGVEFFGWLHGMTFIAYLVVTLVTAVALRWRWWVAVVAILAAIPPLTTILAERWIAGRGDLALPSVRRAATGG